MVDCERIKILINYLDKQWLFGSEHQSTFSFEILEEILKNEKKERLKMREESTISSSSLIKPHIQQLFTNSIIFDIRNILGIHVGGDSQNDKIVRRENERFFQNQIFSNDLWFWKSYFSQFHSTLSLSLMIFHMSNI